MLQLINILGPITIITVIGFVLGRSSVGLQSHTLGATVILVATPSLIFYSLVSMHVSPAMLGHMALAALSVIAVACGLGLIWLRLTGGPVRAFLPSLMLPNSGNVGLPLVILTFGDSALQLGVSYFFVVALVQHSLGLLIASGSINLGHLARQPLIYAVLLVLVVTVFDLPVPEMILKTTEILGGMMIPAMLILLGVSLATLGINDIRSAVLIAVGRLVIGVISATAVIFVLGLSGIMAGSVFLLATMPTAIVTFVYAERYGQSPSEVAGGIVMSTLLTFLCLPGLIWTALWIAAL